MRRTAIGMSFLLMLLTCGCAALGRDIEVSSLTGSASGRTASTIHS